MLALDVLSANIASTAERAPISHYSRAFPFLQSAKAIEHRLLVALGEVNPPAPIPKQEKQVQRKHSTICSGLPEFDWTNPVPIHFWMWMNLMRNHIDIPMTFQYFRETMTTVWISNLRMQA